MADKGRQYPLQQHSVQGKFSIMEECSQCSLYLTLSSALMPTPNYLELWDVLAASHYRLCIHWIQVQCTMMQAHAQACPVTTKTPWFTLLTCSTQTSAKNVWEPSKGKSRLYNTKCFDIDSNNHVRGSLAN